MCTARDPLLGRICAGRDDCPRGDGGISSARPRGGTLHWLRLHGRAERMVLAWMLAAAAALAQEEGPLDLPLPEAPARPEPDPARGKTLFQEKCAVCHGAEGKGDGPAARQMLPRPRDFTQGVFKLRSTASGSPPTDADLYRTITGGIRGTAMIPFGGLAPDERWQLLHHLRSLAADRRSPEVIAVPQPPPPSPGLVERGRALYDAMGCAQCHGPGGRGDGPAAAELADDWGQPIPPFDMTRGWRLKGGSEPSDIYRTLHTGLDGTPMPSYHGVLSDRDTWALVYFIRSLFLDP